MNNRLLQATKRGRYPVGIIALALLVVPIPLADSPAAWLDRVLTHVSLWFPDRSFFNLTWNLHAFLALILVSLTCGAVGSLVVGNRMAFFSDALAHCAFAGVCLGFLLFQLFLAGSRPKEEFWQWVTPFLVVFGVVVGLGIAHVRFQTGLASDTVIGVFFAASIGLVGMLQAVIRDRAVFGLEEFLFGAPEYVSATELFYLAGMLIVTAATLAWLYNPLTLSSFNTSLALSRRVNVRLCQYAFVALLALVVNLSLRCVGVLLINALLIVPAATMIQVGRNLRQVFWLTTLLCLVTALGGQLLSWELGIRTDWKVGTSGTIVLLNVAAFFVGTGLAAWWRRQDREPRPT